MMVNANKMPSALFLIISIALACSIPAGMGAPPSSVSLSLLDGDDTTEQEQQRKVTKKKGSGKKKSPSSSFSGKKKQAPTPNPTTAEPTASPTTAEPTTASPTGRLPLVSLSEEFCDMLVGEEEVDLEAVGESFVRTSNQISRRIEIFIEGINTIIETFANEIETQSDNLEEVVTTFADIRFTDPTSVWNALTSVNDLFDEFPNFSDLVNTSQIAQDALDTEGLETFFFEEASNTFGCVRDVLGSVTPGDIDSRRRHLGQGPRYRRRVVEISGLRKIFLGTGFLALISEQGFVEVRAKKWWIFETFVEPAIKAVIDGILAIGEGSFKAVDEFCEALPNIDFTFVAGAGINIPFVLEELCEGLTFLIPIFLLAVQATMELLKVALDYFSQFLDMRNEYIDWLVSVAGYVNGITPNTATDPEARRAEARRLLTEVNVGFVNADEVPIDEEDSIPFRFGPQG